jgi:hypothetical protein
MKIGAVVYKRLLAQAQEAKDQGFTKLADGVLGAIGACPDEDRERYSYGQLLDDIHGDLWKIATRLINYYDIKSADAMKLDGVLDRLAGTLMDEVETGLGVENVVVGANDEKVPGQH